MGGKPPQCAQIRAGQWFGAVEHMVPTFNWMVNWISNIDVGEGLKFKDKDSDNPKLEIDIKFEADANSPFKITKSSSSGRYIISSNNPEKEKEKKLDPNENQNAKPDVPGNNAPIETPNYTPNYKKNKGKCNIYSDTPDNDWTGGSPDNNGDNCKELNGW